MKLVHRNLVRNGPGSVKVLLPLAPPLHVPFHHEVLLAETLTSAPVDVKSRCNLGYPFFQLME